MIYKDMVAKVQDYAGLSEAETESSIKTFVKLLANRLTAHERTGFVSELPQELQSEAASTDAEPAFSMANMIETMAEQQQIDRDTAQRRVSAVWKTLKELLPRSEYESLKNDLPKDVLGELSSSA